MRLKNVKGAKERLVKSPYIISNPEDYKGKINEIFNNKNPLHLEIGMGKGNFIINMAKKYPNINFIGIEKFDSVLVRAVEKLDNEDIPNLRVIRYDAIHIDNLFSHEVDTIYLNFSDPWPKNRHENRRLSSKIFLELYDNVFRGNNHIIMKTDNRKLFEFSIISFTDYKYKINEISLDLYGDDYKDNVPTEYETKFVEKGQLIYRIDVTK